MTLFSIFYPIHFGREVIVTVLMIDGGCHTISRTEELPKLFGTLLWRDWPLLLDYCATFYFSVDSEIVTLH